MNIVFISGGLGNQMFQYAFGLALSQYNSAVKYDISKYKYYQIHNNFELARVFDIKANYASAEERKKLGYYKDNRITRFLLNTPLRKKSVYCEKESGYDSQVFGLDNTYFKGYWQTEKYFTTISDMVKSVFSFPQITSKALIDLSSEIEKNNSVSLHVRRGDYLDHPLYKGICDLEYYNKAYDFISGKLGNDFLLFVFSNDPEWVKCNLNYHNMIIVDINSGESSYRDMQLMSMCKHNIISNSSFSWWGAWLNNNKDQIVVAPSKWVNSEKNLFNEVVPERWIKI